MTQVEANSQNYGFAYADNGLLASRANPFRTLAINARDVVGRILQQTTLVGGNAAMVETMTWRDNSTLNSYAVNRTGTGAWNESRAYSYNNRGQLLNEGFSPAAGQTDTLNYTFDGSTTRLGIRTDAKIGSGAPVSWESAATTINALGRVTADQVTEAAQVVPASGVSLGADHVDLLVDGTSQGRATHPGFADPVGAWSANLNVVPGSHTFTANAVHPSNQYTATASSTFTVAGNGSGGDITSAYDDDGNVTSRTWSTGRAQTLTWDAYGRLIQVVDRDSGNNGSDWSAVYDGLGRRLKVTQQTVTAGVASGAVTVTTSIYDPQVEFLEIGVAVNGARAWKVYGPDLNGRYGSLQGTGGLEATVVDAGGATKGVLNDQFGNGVGTITSGTFSWVATRVSAYGPLPGSTAETLTDVTRVAEATAWRNRRVDATGFIYLGARYYEPTSGRFLSTDPRGHGASMSLYDFANGDPVNYFDPDGRFGKQANNIGPDGIRYIDSNIYPTADSAAPNSLAGGNLALDVAGAALGGAGDYAKGLLWTGPKALVSGLYNLVTTNPVTTVNNLTNGLGTLAGNLTYNTSATLSAAGNAILKPENIGVGVFTAGTFLVPGALASRTGSSASFFEGTSYTAKVLRQMEGGVGEFHSFPESVTAFESAGTVRVLRGGDGVLRQTLEIPGSYAGHDGAFQFIKNADGTINHRLFVPGGGP